MKTPEEILHIIHHAYFWECIDGKYLVSLIDDSEVAVFPSEVAALDIRLPHYFSNVAREYIVEGGAIGIYGGEVVVTLAYWRDESPCIEDIEGKIHVLSYITDIDVDEKEVVVYGDFSTLTSFRTDIDGQTQSVPYFTGDQGSFFVVDRVTLEATFPDWQSRFSSARSVELTGDDLADVVFVKPMPTPMVSAALPGDLDFS